MVSTVFSDRYHKAVQGMRDLMRSYPGMEMGHHLNDHLHLLEAQATPHSEYPVEVLLLDMPGEEQLFRLLAFLEVAPEAGRNLPMRMNDAAHGHRHRHVLRGGEAAYRVDVYHSAHMPVRSTANLSPCLKLAFWFGKEPPGADLDPVLLRLDAEGGILFLCNHAPDDFIARRVPTLKHHPLPPDQMPETLSAMLGAKPLQNLLPMAHALRLLEGLEKISTSFQQFTAQQEKDIKTKKFNAQQDINAVKMEEKLNLRDLFQQLKNGLQRNFAECERGLTDGLARLVQRHSPNSLMARVEDRVTAVESLQEDSFAGSIRMTLPAGTTESLTDTISTGLRAQMDQDIFGFKEFVRQEATDLAEKLKGHHIAFAHTPQMQINLSRVEINMAEHVRFAQKYEAEKKKLQFTDYMRAATAPFMGVMSLFMISRFIPGNFGKLLKNSMPIIGLILAPVAVYTFYQFLKNTKARKAHDYDTELNRMRDGLLAESRAMVRKVADDWQREIIGGLREELNRVVEALEQTIARAGEEHKEKVQQAQRAVQRRVQGLEQRERSHQNALKSKETYDRALAQFKGELMHQYKQQQQQL